MELGYRPWDSRHDATACARTAVGLVGPWTDGAPIERVAVRTS
jgi:hypothetical protein